MYQLKAINIYHLTIFVGQDLGRSLAGWFWLRLSHKDQTISQSSHHLGLDLENPLPSSPMWFLAGLSFSPGWPLYRLPECPSFVAPGFPRASDLKKGEAERERDSKFDYYSHVTNKNLKLRKVKWLAQIHAKLGLTPAYVLLQWPSCLYQDKEGQGQCPPCLFRAGGYCPQPTVDSDLSHPSGPSENFSKLRQFLLQKRLWGQVLRCL